MAATPLHESLVTGTEAIHSGSTHKHDDPKSLGGHERDVPTASHALAEENVILPFDAERDHDAVTQENGTDVSDLAWEDPYAVFQPRIMGMSHEDFWLLIRRFNYIVFRVKAIEDRPDSDLDMEMSQHDKTSPEKLRVHLGRLYMSVIVGLVAAWKHLARLRSWNEPRRTSAFLSAYAVALMTDLLVPTLFLFLLALVAFPSSRPILFPPAPQSLINAKEGVLQKPPAGVMASKTSVTGAPEKHKGKAVEEEAHTVVNSFFKVITRFASDDADDQGSDEDNPGPGLAKIADKFADAKANTDRSQKAPENDDKTRDPMKHALEDVDIQPLLDGLFAFIDTWERFANALSPTARFRAYHSRVMLCSTLVLPALVSCYLSRDTIIRTSQFCAGLVLFGKPLIRRSCDFLDSFYPDWHRYCQLRNTILKGSPTNAQLTLTMLRIGERSKSPLLPSPASSGPTQAKPATTPASLRQLGATDEEIRQAIDPDPNMANSEGEDEPRSKPLLERFMEVIKRSSKRGVHVFHKVEKKRADHGNEHAQERLDIGQSTGQISAKAGPQRFPARYDGVAGYVYVTTDAVTPSIRWSSNKDDGQTAWTVNIEDIADLSKIKGMNPKKGEIVRWALDKELIDGLILTTTDGKSYQLGEVFKRNEVFNRLVAIGNQMWEMY